MSDFLVDLGGVYAGKALVASIQRKYGVRPPNGAHCSFAWGTVAFVVGPNTQVLLDDEGGPEKKAAWVLISIGDLVAPSLKEIAEILSGLSECLGRDPGAQFDAKQLLSSLNGAFAMFFGRDEGFAVCTDPVGSVSIYVAVSREGAVKAVGTHPDLVARLTDSQDELDALSVCEFLNRGAPCFPNTLYTRVKELGPGRVYWFGRDGHRWSKHRGETYWLPPEEADNFDIRTAADELATKFVAAVKDRCTGGRVGVYLSGGLDSRIVLASVPRERECVAVTFCDKINREARTAQRVAKVYGREWIPLFRDTNYLARHLRPVGQLIGSECEWLHAHGAGFAGALTDLGFEIILTGLLMNNLVRGYYAADVRRKRRLLGLLPPKYEIVPFDYAGSVSPFCMKAIHSRVIEGSVERLRDYSMRHFGHNRPSRCEWLDVYPFSQAGDNTMWVAERRLVPMRLATLDRRILDLVFRLPISIKLDTRFYKRVVGSVCGKGARIRNANDGISPTSGYVLAIFQRSLRKAEDWVQKSLRLCGRRSVVHHSWHDYQHYWETNPLIQEQVHKYWQRLKIFEGEVFQVSVDSLICDPSLIWKNGFRILQLALWRDIVEETP